MRCRKDKKIDKILPYLLILNGNDASSLKKETRLKFEKLIICLMKIKYNIRYCSSKFCKCHPETIINELLIDDKLSNFLNKNNHGEFGFSVEVKNALEVIKSVIKESDESITIYDD
ncbi:MAG: hypothetical protein LBP36_00090 [Oscillospiraceae bacterium]|jgi:hypothetical protein|nr:hypothetical protein [Oscillospiraceae bacterium]